MPITIEQITDKQRKLQISRLILESLPEWFGIPEAREEYVADSADQIMVAATDAGQPVGFLCLKETGRDTVELAVMGVLKEYHRQGIGRLLFEAAKEIAAKGGYSFLQVKTVQMGHYESYDKTNLFYLSLGFREFEVLPTLWDEGNPCQIYVMSLEQEEQRRNTQKDIIGKTVHGKIDRPLGSTHPKHPDMIYPVNYGYVEGVYAGDGEEQDVYVLGTDQPIDEFRGTVIAVYHRTDDVEDKWIVSLDGRDYSDREILEKLHFQEQYFAGYLIR